MFEYESSEVDWCESNYDRMTWIAEFYNTVSNIPYITIPLVWLYFQTEPVYLPLGLVFIGASSMYFHATLSLAGQFLDELGILYLAITMVFYYVEKLEWKLFPPVIVLGTSLCLVYPALNAYWLISLSLPGMSIILYRLITRPRCDEIFLFCLTIIFGGIGIVCWIIDRMYCDLWLNYEYPQFHAWWHIFIFISGCCCISLLIKSKKR